MLGCGAHLTDLTRTRSGNFVIEDSIDGTTIREQRDAVLDHLILLNQS